MDDPHIDDLVAQAERHRRLRAPQGGGAWPIAAMSSWRQTRVGAVGLALSIGVATAAVGIPLTPEAVMLNATDAHAERVRPAASAASSSTDASLSEPPAMPLSASPARARPHIRPALSDEVRVAALQEGKRLRAMVPGTEMTAFLQPTPAGVTRAANAKASAIATSASSTPAIASVHTRAHTNLPADGAPAYALVTDITHTRIASELRQQLMGSSATVGDLPGAPRTELMQVSTGWRAVVWPFATENEADKARRMLAERGIRTELLKF